MGGRKAPVAFDRQSRRDGACNLDGAWNDGNAGRGGALRPSAPGVCDGARPPAARSTRLRLPSTPSMTVVSPTAEPPVLAPRALALIERVGGAALLCQLATLYAGYAPQRVADARAAIAAADAPTLRAACHALKSGSAQLGVERVSARCAALEADATAGVVAAPAAIDALEADLAFALAALAARVAVTAAEPIA